MDPMDGVGIWPLPLEQLFNRNADANRAAAVHRKRFKKTS